MILNFLINFLFKFMKLLSKKLFFVLIFFLFAILAKFFAGSIPNTVKPLSLKHFKNVPSFEAISHIKSLDLSNPYILITSFE